ncbi:Uncharacterised protein [Mycobacteroides abscessus subsp. abscessus]|nr:Uncharacterised protein [Mycobacteroides abscessus subsp. abscessus]
MGSAGWVRHHTVRACTSRRSSSTCRECCYSLSPGGERTDWAASQNLMLPTNPPPTFGVGMDCPLPVTIPTFVIAVLAHSFTTSSIRSCGAVTSCPQQVQRPLRLVSIEACTQFPIVQTCSAQMNTSTAGLSQWSTRWMVTMKSAGLQQSWHGGVHSIFNRARNAVGVSTTVRGCSDTTGWGLGCVRLNQAVIAASPGRSTYRSACRSCNAF